MREFFRAIVHALEAGQPAVLVSILTSSGSTPRGCGAMMAVFSQAAAVGTIGGGNVEFTAQKLAGELIQSGQSASRDYRFAQGDAASLGMVCGGDVRVHFQYLAPGDKAAIAALRDLIETSGQNTGVWLVRRLEGDQVTVMRCATADNRNDPELAALLEEKPLMTPEGWFSIPVERPGRVYLFGGGHVSQELVTVLARVGFRTVVYDDRAEFADPARFPQAERTLCGDFTRLKEQLSITPDDYVVVMTRGHQADYEVLREVLRSGARYIGCIGSKRKLALCRERLIAADFTPEEYARLHAPIGLAIGAETPEEIAISVAAEMIAVRAGVEG